MATTAEKIEAAVQQAMGSGFDLFSIDPANIDKPELRDMLYVAQSFLGNAGIDPAQLLQLAIPTDPVEADILLDKCISFLFELRGDDLPPFDPGRWGEATDLAA